MDIVWNISSNMDVYLGFGGYNTQTIAWISWYIMGYRQMVRHSTLTAAFVGSIPTSSVLYLLGFSVLHPLAECWLKASQIAGGV